MGELVVSSDGKMELEVEETEIAQKGEKQSTKKLSNGGATTETAAASGGVRWERFLSKMVVRVLLVEADDSTRQIITALLRKCSYRVAAVADGLKAWELLKESPCNIDLILTEVELPSISGYALLTLIMEHEVCKNIPVIMMSSQDSVSTVYKCMLRGATDFLVKPVRKNELRNLWQHVWRKQASNTAAGLGPPDESVQEKDETTGENNAISNHSSGYMSSIQRNREWIEKGSDAQSSCTKPESETEGEVTEHGHCLSMPKSAKKCLSDDINISRQEECHQESKSKQEHDNETRETQAVADDFANGPNEENTHILENSSREAIDLIGTFDNHFKCTLASNVSANKFDVLPFLDLSLRRSHPSVNPVNDEKTRLNHSDASPFSRYINKPLLVQKPTSPITYNQQEDQEINSEKQSSNYTPDNHVPMATIQTGHPEITFSYSRNQEISHPIPVRGVRFENTINTYNSLMPSLYGAQSGTSSLSSPHTPHHTEPFPQLNQFYPSEHQPSSSHNLVDQRISNSNCQNENKHIEKSENMEDQGLISPGNDQSGNSSFCTGNKSHEESVNVHEGASQRSMLREAALNKFRMKRKDRCFEKKVRYESRKKLAEQRPRVKGQFVRQVPNDPQPGN